MSLQVIGAGLGRTGTTSLKLALERLLGGPCYHMYEVFQHPEHVPAWHGIVRGRVPEWEAIYEGYVASVDWPGAAFWEPLHDNYPDALVLLSVRDSAAIWYRSVNATINELFAMPPHSDTKAWRAMAADLLRTRFVPIPFDVTSATATYEHHNAEVRATVPPARLLEWRVGDGWEPICERLGVPVPDEPFPHVNTRDEYQAVLDRRPPRQPWQRVVRRLRRS